MKESHSSHQINYSSRISGLRAVADGVFVSFTCAGCGGSFESYLITLGSLPMGRNRSPCCGYSHDLSPEEFEIALTDFFPLLTREEMIELTEEATRITESWYRVGPMADLLSYKGINLGEGIEREVMPVVIQGLIQARNAKRRKVL